MEDIQVIDCIKDICKEKSWSYYRLAKEANIAYSSLNTMIKHYHIPTINNLIKICNGFNITLTQFFYRIENIPDEEQELIRLFNSLDSTSKELLQAYLYGLLKKIPKPRRNEDDLS